MNMLRIEPHYQRFPVQIVREKFGTLKTRTVLVPARTAKKAVEEVVESLGGNWARISCENLTVDRE